MIAFYMNPSYTYSLLFVLILGACSQKPEPITLYENQGEYCKMVISDHRFAAQLVTAKGKSLKFDAIECMADYRVENREKLKGAKLWVSDFNDPQKWLSVDEAVFIKSREIQSPMGESLLALASQKEAEKHLAEYNGRQISWQTILKNARND